MNKSRHDVLNIFDKEKHMSETKNLNQHHYRRIYIMCIIFFFVQFFSVESLLHAQIFLKVQSSETGVPRGRTFGAGWIDFNHDGYLDLVCNNYDQPVTLYINKKDGSFAMSDALTPLGVGSYFSGITWGDFDNNGENDLFLTTLQGGNVLLKNLGSGNFVRVENSQANTIPDIHLHCTYVDYDNDGWLDLFVPTVASFNFVRGGGSESYLFHNKGNGIFERVTSSGLTSDLANHQCANFADYDNDGDLDLFTTDWQNDNLLFENNGDGTFTNTTGTGLNANTSISMTCCWGDYDNDGFLDLFVGNGSGDNVTRQNNMLYHNNGNKTFTKIMTGDLVNTPSCTWTSVWSDVDNDGDLDLLTGELMDANAAYINDGKGNFTKTNIFSAASTGTSGLVLGDYDNDGFLDLYASEASGLGNTLYHNVGNSNNWLMITCEGKLSNRSGIGAKIKIKTSISGKPLCQMREINGNQGFRSFCDIKGHFGLGDATMIDSLIVEWPSKMRTVRTNVTVNQILKIEEDVPEGTLKARFINDVSEGTGSFTVNFQDLSISSGAHPIVSRAWDLDGDGIDDSHEQNPVFTYHGTEGRLMSVRLIVSDGQKSDTVRKENLIQLIAKNYASGKTVTASSFRSTAYSPLKAIDGNPSSYWASQSSDDEWIMINLDSAYTINKITLRWHAQYYAAEYLIQTAVDTLNWSTVSSRNNSAGGVEEIFFAPVQAKYVRIHCLKRASGNTGLYGIYEIEVNRQYVNGVEESHVKPESFQLEQNYPNPFNPTTRISFSIVKKAFTTLYVFDVLGRQLSVLVNREMNPGSYTYLFAADHLPSGIYFYRLQTAEEVATKKMVLLR